MKPHKKYYPNCECYILPPHVLDSLVEQNAITKEEVGASYEHANSMMASRLDVSTQTANAFLPPAGGANRYIYNSQDTTNLDVELVRKEGDAPVADASINEVYDNCGKVRDFYSSQYGYNSVDNNGKDLKMNVHYNVMNALWQSGTDQMFFGKGNGSTVLDFTSALDVTAHEITHGVVEYSAGLIYQGQSGALNEHIADVFATTIKQFYAGQNAQSGDWLIGNTIIGPSWPGKAIRSMQAPGTAYRGDMQPANMAHYYNGPIDNQGVHINSGILNKAFYNVACGINGQKGLDTALAGTLWFQSLRNITNKQCAFHEFYSILTSTAKTMMTDGKLPQGADALIGNAFADVGIS